MKSVKPGKKIPAAKAGVRSGNKSGPSEKKFSRVLQTDIPSYTLDKVLTVPQTLADQFARKPVSPLKLAAAMKVQPASPSFRMLTGAAIAYGLTKGGWNAAQIELTPLGTRIVHVTREDDDLLAKREALLMPRVFGTFLTRYDGHPIPRKDIAVNILKDLDVPDDRAESALDMMLDGARAVGFITTINSKDYVSLEGTSIPQPDETPGEVSAEEMEEAAQSA